MKTYRMVRVLFDPERKPHDRQLRTNYKGLTEEQLLQLRKEVVRDSKEYRSIASALHDLRHPEHRTIRRKNRGEKVNAYARKYYSEHKKEYAARARIRNKLYAEEKNLYQRDYNARNRDRVRAWHRAYQSKRQQRTVRERKDNTVELFQLLASGLSQTKVAKLLGISRQTVANKIKQARARAKNP